MNHDEITRAKRAWERAQRNADSKWADLQAATIAAVENEELSESAAARAAGVGRQTLRRWRGQKY